MLHPKVRADEGRTFPGPCEVDLGPVQVEAVESGKHIHILIQRCKAFTMLAAVRQRASIPGQRSGEKSRIVTI